MTMEMVAREANVAKATLYSHFKNKDELYVAVCARMAGLLRSSVEQALTKPDSDLDARLADAVVAETSARFHSDPRIAALRRTLLLYAQHGRRDLRQPGVEMLEMLRAAMAEDPELAPTAEQLARALYFGGAALAMRSESTPQMELEVGAFARAQIAGAHALAQAESRRRPRSKA